MGVENENQSIQQASRDVVEETKQPSASERKQHSVTGISASKTQSIKDEKSSEKQYSTEERKTPSISEYSVDRNHTSFKITFNKETDDLQEEIKSRTIAGSIHQIKEPSQSSKVSLVSPSLSITLTSIKGSTTRDISRIPTRQSVTPDAEAATAELLSIISPERIKSSTTRFKYDRSFAFTRRKSFERPSRTSAVRPGSVSSFRIGDFDRSKIPKQMNTYRLDPGHPFKPDHVRHIIKTVLEKELEGLKYDAVQCAMQTMILSNDIRNKVKLLGFDRHKLICTVDIGEKNNQSIFSGARFLWDSERDNFAFYRYENTYIFALACVYGIYYE